MRVRERRESVGSLGEQDRRTARLNEIVRDVRPCRPELRLRYRVGVEPVLDRLSLVPTKIRLPPQHHDQFRVRRHQNLPVVA